MGIEPSLRLRPLTAPDLALLVDWVERPHVSRWWHDPVGWAEIEAHYLPCVTGTDPTHALIVELEGEPIGFAQWYRWLDYPDYGGKLRAADDEAGMDYLLGSERHCGHGVGTRLIAALLDLVRHDWPDARGVVIDPEVANQASRRVLEKNGLQLVFCAQVEEPSAYGPSAVYRLRFSAPPRSREIPERR
jgi:aminoglycoside 6'-N-acetyltransferase